MAGCSVIKANGERCRGIAATGSDYCPAHDPARAEQRKRSARKAARSKDGGAELRVLKRGIRTVTAAVLSGRLDRGRAAVGLQGYNLLLRAYSEGRNDLLEELARDVEELKRGISGAA